MTRHALAAAAVAAALLTATVILTTPAPAPAAPAAAEPEPDRKPFPGDRTYSIGRDLGPGVYATSGAADPDGVCYWARLDSDKPDVESIIEDGSGDSRQRVAIKATDRAFASRGCATWSPA